MAAGKAAIQSTTGNMDIGIQPAANSLPHRPSPPAGLQAGDRRAELRAGPGLAGQEDEITPVYTGDLSRDERCCTNVTMAWLLLPQLSHTVFP